jgi:hypothetical protein
MLELALAVILASPATTVIADVSIVDAEANAIHQHRNVEFAGDKIIKITSGKPNPKARKIDGKGKFLIPGLWDMHVHWYDKPTLGLFTANGVTGIREMFGTRELLSWRDAIEAGKMAGPRMVVGSPIIDGPKPIWGGSIAVGTENEDRATLRRVKAAGYDFAKVYSFLPPPAYFGIMDEARKLGYPVDGHIPDRVSVAQAVEAGQRCAEHLYEFPISTARRETQFRKTIENFVPKGNNAIMDALFEMEDAIDASRDPEKEAALFGKVKDAPMYQCVTLVVHHALANFFDPAFRNHPYKPYMFKSALNGFWVPPKVTNLKPFLAVERKALQIKMDLARRMHAAGVPIVAGTDVLNPYTFPGFSLHDELGFLVKIGMTPAEALCAATITPARMLKKEATMGTIKVGAAADLVLLDANPLDDIHNTKRISTVIQRGRVFSHPELDSIKRRAREYMRRR